MGAILFGLLALALSVAASAQVYVFVHPYDKTQQLVTVKAAKHGCDASYSTTCIPPSPPDLDCNEVGYRKFDVGARNPYGFDRDRNGIGCD